MAAAGVPVLAAPARDAPARDPAAATSVAGATRPAGVATRSVAGATGAAASNEAPALARAAIARGRELLALGDAPAAAALADAALSRLDGMPAANAVRAHLLLLRAEARRALGQAAPALADAAEAASLAEDAGQPALVVHAQVLAAELHRAERAFELAASRLASAARHAAALADPGLHAVYLLADANLALARADPVRALDRFEAAAQFAAQAGEELVAAKARGAAAEVLAQQGRLDEAIVASRRAAFLAQRWPAYQSAYHGLLGRLLERRGEVDGAIDALRLAVETGRGLRAAPGAGDASGAGGGEASTTELLADLLLRRATDVDDEGARSALLREAREAIESGKAAELRDYFRDDCVTELQARITPVDRLPAGSAIVYPVLLPDRVELLVSLPDAIRQVRVPVGREQLTASVRRLRQALEKRTTREFLVPARELHAWLVAPLEPMLRAASIDTLVFVPQGPLRTVPMAALHDGSRFVIERYAVATTPGLTLTDARPLRREGLRALVAGLSRSVAGFPALERVPQELARVRELLGGTVLQDEAFVAPRFGAALERGTWSVVHVASHAQFDRDPDRTFLLAYDGRLGLQRLADFVGVSQYRAEPIELLTLSACQTAAGDDRAALGLAGIAVKAGARSALAGLWFVDDAVSAELVSRFYLALREDPGASKARALQRAQNALLADRRYRHPGYWAPYLLIGNWQ